MKLRTYLDERAISNGQFGETIGRTAEAVRRYAAGERIPDKETMPLIVEHTGGWVQPNDFFDLPDTPPPFPAPLQGTDLPAPGTDSPSIPATPKWGSTRRSGSSAVRSTANEVDADAKVAA